MSGAAWPDLAVAASQHNDNAARDSVVKRKRIVLSLKQKLEIVNRLDKGEKLAVLAKEYNVGKSSVLDIKMRKDSLLKYVSSFANVENMNMRKTMKTSYNKELDQAVFEWYLAQTKKGESLSGPDICNKALEINKSLGGSQDFKASGGWLKNFKFRHGIIPGSGTMQLEGLLSMERRADSPSNSVTIDTCIEAVPRKKRKHVILSLKDKLDIITRLHKGEMAANLAREYNIGKSTVNDIKMKQDALFDYVSSFPNCDNMHQRKTMKSAFNKDLDRALYNWYCECLRNGISVSGPAICDKALDLNKECGGDPDFKASGGWLQNFKSRHGLHLSGNESEKFGDFTPDLYPNIYFDDENADSSGCDSVHSTRNEFPNCDVILDVPDEHNISSTNTSESRVSHNDSDTACNVAFEPASNSSELLGAFKTVIEWTERQKECSSADVINLLKLHELAYLKGVSLSNDSEAMSRNIDAVYNEGRDESISVETMYEIDRCAEWIKGHDFSKIALQFPESMLTDATTVSLKLGEMTQKQLFILGDTSYGSCCVDEISAGHVSADALIHFGHSCLSPTSRLLPVLYAFGRQPLDLEDAARAFRKFFPDKRSSVVLIYEAMYSYATDALAEKLRDYSNLAVSQLEIPDETFEDSEPLVPKLHRTIPCLDNPKAFYIGHRPSSLTHCMLALKNLTFYSYNPKVKSSQVETLSANQDLRRRHHYIMKAREANTIGLVVGYHQESVPVVSRLEELIRQAGKKSLTIVGDAAKLARFGEIEVFVRVGCAGSTPVQSRPVITPYELGLALDRERRWTGDYGADFGELLPGAVPSARNAGAENDVTGQIRPASSEVEEHSAASVVTRNDMTVHSKAAGDFLAQKSWRGFEQCLDGTPVTAIDEETACRYDGADVK